MNEYGFYDRTEVAHPAGSYGSVEESTPWEGWTSQTGPYTSANGEENYYSALGDPYYGERTLNAMGDPHLAEGINASGFLQTIFGTKSKRTEAQADLESAKADREFTKALQQYVQGEGGKGASTTKIVLYTFGGVAVITGIALVAKYGLK